MGQDTEELRRRAEQLLGRPLSDAEILRLLRQSGLAPDEVRDLLQQQGFPRGAADPYLSVLEGSEERVPQGTDPLALLRVLAELGARDTLPGPRPLPRRITRLREARRDTAREPAGPPVFGREIFERATSQFLPPTTGPVPGDYRVGPGDELILVLTGDVEQAYRLTVTREGWIVIPDVGRVFVNGLTMEELEDVLFNRLSEAYSGIRRGPEASAFFDVSLGKLRTNQVYVIGEVVEPGAYEVSSLATALTALYWAGGPGRAGSFRNVLVNRGGETTRRVDLYDYLLRGDASQDIRLEQGDIVFVPTAERRIRVDGAVIRPAIYELKEGETLADAIRFAGGVQPEADLRRVQIQRVLPADRRAPGADRAILDVSLTSPAEAEDVPLRDGDRVTVFAVLDEARNWVVVAGGVWHPGTYAVEADTRLWDVIERAGGLLPDAYEPRAQIQRLEEDDWTRRMIQVDLARDSEGRPEEDPELRGMDQIFVYAKRGLREERVVSIGGWVQQPGVYPFVDGMTVRDLVLRAGGMRTGVYLGHAEVSRVVISQSHTDTLTRRFRVALDSSYVLEGGGPERRAAPARADGEPGSRGDGGADGSREPDSPPADRFVLQNLDAVYVRKSPGFTPQQNVLVTGEVILPGPYSLETRVERLTHLVERAGGLTPEAYPEGLQLWRAERVIAIDTLTAAEIAGRTFGDTLTAEERRRLEEAGEIPQPLRERTQVERTRVGVDFVQAMRRPDGSQNVLIEPNDSIFVPRYIPTVEVRGAVGLATRVLYKRGGGLGYYIDQAGGYAENADKGRTRVRYANGEVRTRGGKFLFFGGGVPDPDPGSVITVPVEPERERGGFRVTELVGILTSVMTAAATVIIATQ